MKLNPCQAFCQLSDGGGSSIDTLEIDLENGTRCYNSLSSFDVCIGRKCEVKMVSLLSSKSPL